MFKPEASGLSIVVFVDVGDDFSEPDGGGSQRVIPSASGNTESHLLLATGSPALVIGHFSVNDFKNNEIILTSLFHKYWITIYFTIAALNSAITCNRYYITASIFSPRHCCLLFFIT